ncbi:MAG: ATP-binding protein [Vicinamibacterales bacterium]
MRWWSRQPLTVKLPVTTGVLLLAAFAVLSLVLHSEMRQTLVRVSGDRLSHAAEQLSGLLAVSARQRMDLLEALADSSEIREQLSAGRGPSPGATTALERYAASPGQSLGVEIWSATGERLVAAGAPFAPPSPAQQAAILQAVAATPGTAQFSPLWLEDDGVGYAVGVAVVTTGEIRSYVVERRRLANQEQAVELLTGFIGTRASILVGNGDRTVWTDLAAPVDGPPARVDLAAPVLEYTRGAEGAVFAAARPVAGTPWVAAVEISRDDVLAPADRLLARAAAIGSVLALATVLMGWVLSRRITTPLIDLAGAAGAVAEGRDPPPVLIRGHDELARLGEAFNTMAARVIAGRHEYENLVRDLESRVEQRTAALQETNREIESFSYSVSHDLRAPLRAIAGFAQILDEDARDKLDEDSRRTLDVIIRNTRQMGLLIDDLLAFSRLGRQALAPTTVDMVALAGDVAEQVRGGETGRVIDIDIGPLPQAEGDPALLRQVYVNLLQNAVKFTRPRDRAHVEVGTVDQGAVPTYYVRDNGVGFDMQYADKLFGVFQRLHRAQDFDGTGVGLAIVQRVISRHGGRVWAESAPDAGATFYFTLPRAGLAEAS